MSTLPHSPDDPNHVPDGPELAQRDLSRFIQPGVKTTIMQMPEGGAWRVYVGRQQWPNHDASILCMDEAQARALRDRIRGLWQPEDLTWIGEAIGRIVASYDRYTHNGPDEQVNRMVERTVRQWWSDEAMQFIAALNRAVIDATY